jgi:hypothetical protein
LTHIGGLARLHAGPPAPPNTLIDRAPTMTPSPHPLQCLPPQSLDTVVDLGARPRTWSKVRSARRPRRLVLVQGEPALAEALRQEIAAGLQAELVEAVVAPATGAATWYDCNVDSCSGLLDPTPMDVIFPRLRVVERRRVKVRGLVEVLDEVFSSGPCPSRSLLLCNQPGTEASLLRALPARWLSAFDWLLLRSVRDGLLAGADRLDDAIRVTAGMQPVFMDEHSEPAWPVCLLRADRAAAELATLRAALEAQRAEHAKTLQRVAEVERARAEADEQRARQLQRLQQLEEELAQASQRQQALRDELLKAEGQMRLLTALLLRGEGTELAR